MIRTTAARLGLCRFGRLPLLVAGVAVAFVATSVAAAPALATPVWEVAAHHGPGNFEAGGIGEYTFVVDNVGDTAASGPVGMEIDLPAGVTTRVQKVMFEDQSWVTVLPGVTASGWDCGPPAAGVSSLSCHSLIDPIRPGANVLARLTVYVAIDAGASGDLPALATVSGGGAGTVSVTETAPVGVAATEFGIAPGTFKADVYDRGGVPERRAGAHPFRATAAFDFNLKRTFPNLFGLFDVPSLEPIGTARNLEVDLPRGFVGNPSAVAECSSSEFLRTFSRFSACPSSSQVGIVQATTMSLISAAAPTTFLAIPVYNMKPPKGVLADFGLSLDGRPVHILARLDPSDYSVVTTVSNVNESTPIHLQRLILWGDPSDPVHDPERSRFVSSTDFGFGAPFGGQRRPFLTLPSECGVPGSVRLRATAWEGATAGPYLSDPVSLSGCDELGFGPSVRVAPDSRVADGPTGLQVDIDLPQNDNPKDLGTPPLRNAEVALPEGMTINPSSADGLQACSDAQLGLKSDSPVGCPDAAKIGTVTATTPVLEDPVGGSVYIRSQGSDDPASGEMFRLALVLEDKDRGLLVKVPGSVSADPGSGRLVARFADNPQLPVGHISVRIKSGPRAPLATPASCGAKSVRAGLSSWGGQVADLSDGFAIDCPGAEGFSPGLVAGPVEAVGGAFSPFVASIERRDRDQYLEGVQLELASGVLARLRGVPLCPEAKAAAGTCDVGSRVGSATVGAGAGSPFFLEDQPVYLAGPYKGAPYSLSVAVRAKAGPFDLGTVVVRQALFVDPTDAHITVKSDPLPTIVKGVPVRLRSVDVKVDRPGFTLNPTSCAGKQIAGTFHSVQGSAASAVAGFRVGDCRALALKPKLKLALTGSSQLTDGRHPGLKATLTQGAGQAGIRRAAVKLPLSLALDPNNAESDALCSFEESVKSDPKCPASSVVGSAKVWTSLLDRPLEGAVYFSKNVRVDAKSGRRIRALPKLVIALRGEVALNLVGTSSTSRDGKLINTFATVPDAPVSRFELSLRGGKKGILVVNGNACRRSRVAVVEIDGHNNKQADQAPKMSAPCAKAARAARKARARQRAATARARQRAAARAHSRR